MKLRDLVHRVRKRPSKSKDGEILEERLEEVLQQRFGIFVLNDTVTSDANAVDTQSPELFDYGIIPKPMEEDLENVRGGNRYST
ncbi:hypothetical protein HG530_003933 [Fusarium avenaceum]|nr:hypothetical protein HG530_003933 [Fusarium avenaceum]